MENDIILLPDVDTETGEPHIGEYGASQFRLATKDRHLQ
jgi:hypothetical protein